MTTLGTARHDVVAGGHRLEVARVTTGVERSPIVLLHEGLGSVAAWRNFPEQLAAATGRDVVAYSRYGHGRSERLCEPRGVAYMHDEAVALRDLLGALGIARPVLFGHSDGASIGLIYAAAHPGEVEALVLEAPHVFVEPLTVASIAAIGEQAASGDLVARLGRYHDDPASTFRGWNDIWLDPRFRAWNITALLPAITAPILMLQGRDDEYGSAAQLEAIAKAVPGSEIVLLDDCGHSPHRVLTGDVLERTRSFLARRRAQREL